MTDSDEKFHHDEMRRTFVSEFEQTLERRLDRYLEIQHAGIVAHPHFSPASSECIDLYRDGYFFSAVMVSQAVAEVFGASFLSETASRGPMTGQPLRQRSSELESSLRDAPAHSFAFGGALEMTSTTIAQRNLRSGVTATSRSVNNREQCVADFVRN